MSDSPRDLEGVSTPVRPNIAPREERRQQNELSTHVKVNFDHEPRVMIQPEESRQAGEEKIHHETKGGCRELSAIGSSPCTAHEVPSQHRLPMLPGQLELRRAMRAATAQNAKKQKQDERWEETLKQTANNNPQDKFTATLEERMKDPEFQSKIPAMVEEHLKKRRIEKQAMASPNDSDQEMSNLPPWDRSVDIEVFGGAEKKKSPADRAQRAENRFTQSVARYRQMNKHPRGDNDKSRYFMLPMSIRYKIAKLVIAGKDGDRAVLLSTTGHEEPVWRFEDSFITWAAVWSSIQDCINSCFGLRANIMVAIFSTFRFHAIFHPYMDSKLNPLPAGFLQEYSMLMQLVTVEIDLTKMGCGVTGGWSKLGYMETALENAVGGFVRAMALRKGLPAMEKLTLVCRKSYGERPDGPRGYSCPYVPDHLLELASPIRQLAGSIGSMRMVGFGERWTAETLLQMWRRKMPKPRAADGEHLKRHRPSDLYPQIASQSSYLDFGPAEGGIKLMRHPEERVSKMTMKNGRIMRAFE